MRIVLVEPLYDINVGKICRAMKNFGFRELYIVNPLAPLGPEAEKYAKRATDILRGARVVGKLEDAVEGCYPVVGTTASLTKGERGLSRPMPLEKAADRIRGKKAAVVFGREDIGLGKEALLKCDMVVYIETSDDYESLNLSNAAAIVLYMLRTGGRESVRGKAPDPKLMRKAMECADKLVSSVENGLQNPNKCKKAFKNILARGGTDDEEVRSIMCVMKRLIGEK